MAKRQISLDRVIQKIIRANYSLDNPGICVACGQDADGIEPDARECECECCGEPAVYGAEELLLMMG